MENSNRDILSAALFQHSSKIQPFKQSSLDRIIERILFFSTNSCLSSEEIQKVFIDTIGYTIPLSVFESSIERLLKNNSVLTDKEDEEKVNFS